MLFFAWLDVNRQSVCLQEADRRIAAEARNRDEKKELIQLRDKVRQQTLQTDQMDDEIERQGARIDQLSVDVRFTKRWRQLFQIDKDWSASYSCFQLARNEKELADQIELNHTVQIRVDHYESLLVEAEEKYEKLNDEKQVLIDHVADLQKQASDLDTYISALALLRHLTFLYFFVYLRSMIRRLRF